MTFPHFISFTLINACNLRCQMCGQWSREGYIKNRTKQSGRSMLPSDWMRLVEEAADHDIRCIILRGGEPFLYPGIMDLLKTINSKGIPVSIDTNGTLLQKYAADLVQLGNMHITFSVDGPEDVHDAVRGVPGSFQKTKANIKLLNDLETKNGQTISKSVCFTISPYSYKGLGQMPEVARSLGIDSINIVPYYYVPSQIGEIYEQELKDQFNCPAYSWHGFHHDDSGIDFDRFRDEYRTYLANLDGITDYPYMDLSEDEYQTWFRDASTPVKSSACRNIEDLIDIQPDGEANFCVDFPDYNIGNVKDASIAELWNSERAQQFRVYRRGNPFAVCGRCGAKYMSEIRD